MFILLSMYAFLLYFVLDFSGHISTVMFSSILTGIIPMLHYFAYLGFLFIFPLLFVLFIMSFFTFCYFLWVFYFVILVFGLFHNFSVWNSQIIWQVGVWWVLSHLFVPTHT